MGALHRGHGVLISGAAARCPVVVVTVFVNPTQFGPNEDLAKYPRTLDADVALAEAAGATLVFAPDAGTMYPADEETRVRVGRTAAALCGVHRPTHFEGVTTIVAKLFSIVGPCAAFFGRKDYQQLQVITRMTKDLFFPVEIVPVRTVREEDGLALSSRNRYLDEEQRSRALTIVRGLSTSWKAFQSGERNARTLESACRELVAGAADTIDYVTVADADTVVPLAETTGERALLAVAARFGGARLIDNVVLGEEPDPLS